VNSPSSALLPVRYLKLLVVAVFLLAGQAAWADSTSTPPLPPTPQPPTNAAASTNAAPPKHGITITADVNDDDADANSGSKHASQAEVNADLAEALIIPLAGIAATFGTPVLIVFVVFYFRYRRRQEALATVREYLNKGLPVPPQLLEDSGKSYAGVNVSLDRRNCDLNRGFKLTFIGLGITLAFLVHNPHSTTWGWGLIPMIMGLGYLLSGWLQGRSSNRGEPLPPPGDKPPL
jgi:hypothetical protein